jgi:hypothetical protein
MIGMTIANFAFMWIRLDHLIWIECDLIWSRKKVASLIAHHQWCVASCCWGVRLISCSMHMNLMYSRSEFAYITLIRSTSNVRMIYGEIIFVILVLRPFILDCFTFHYASWFSWFKQRVIYL